MELWVSETYRDTKLSLRAKRALHSEKSLFQQVDVVETEGMGNLLLLDGMVMTTEADEFVYHEMISHVPLLAMAQPAKRVLVIGGGDGGTVREVLRHPSIEEVVLCEIDEAVVRVSKQYFPALASAFGHPKLTVVIEDGVDFVAKQPDASFDLVILDSTDPLGPGVGLFTVPFYQQVRRILTPTGIMSAQTESPFSEPLGVERIYGNLRQVFNVATAYWGVVPTYPGQLWSWAFCSQETLPHAHYQHELGNELALNCRYYQPELQTAAFALPQVLKRLVKPQVPQLARIL